MRSSLFTALFAAFLGLSMSANAAGLTKFFDAVIHSDPVQNSLEGNSHWDIKSVEHTQTFRCMDCYGFTVKLERFDGSQTRTKKLELVTSPGENGKINVKRAQ